MAMGLAITMAQVLVMLFMAAYLADRVPGGSAYQTLCQWDGHLYARVVTRRISHDDPTDCVAEFRTVERSVLSRLSVICAHASTDLGRLAIDQGQFGAGCSTGSLGILDVLAAVCAPLSRAGAGGRARHGCSGLSSGRILSGGGLLLSRFFCLPHLASFTGSGTSADAGFWPCRTES